MSLDVSVLCFAQICTFIARFLLLNVQIAIYKPEKLTCIYPQALRGLCDTIALRLINQTGSVIHCGLESDETAGASQHFSVCKLKLRPSFVFYGFC